MSFAVLIELESAGVSACVCVGDARNCIECSPGRAASESMITGVRRGPPGRRTPPPAAPALAGVCCC